MWLGVVAMLGWCRPMLGWSRPLFFWREISVVFGWCKLLCMTRCLELWIIENCSIPCQGIKVNVLN